MRGNRNSLILGVLTGMGVTASAALLMGQGSQPDPTRQPSNPGRTEPGLGRASEYFVTGDGSRANLWARDGMTLRWVSSADAGTRMPDTTTPGAPGQPTPKPERPK